MIFHLTPSGGETFLPPLESELDLCLALVKKIVWLKWQGSILSLHTDLGSCHPAITMWASPAWSIGEYEVTQSQDIPVVPAKNMWDHWVLTCPPNDTDTWTYLVEVIQVRLRSQINPEYSHTSSYCFKPQTLKVVCYALLFWKWIVDKKYLRIHVAYPKEIRNRRWRVHIWLIGIPYDKTSHLLETPYGEESEGMSLGRKRNKCLLRNYQKSHWWSTACGYLWSLHINHCSTKTDWGKNILL